MKNTLVIIVFFKFNCFDVLYIKLKDYMIKLKIFIIFII